MSNIITNVTSCMTRCEETFTLSPPTFNSSPCFTILVTPSILESPPMTLRPETLEINSLFPPAWSQW